MALPRAELITEVSHGKKGDSENGIFESHYEWTPFLEGSS